MHKSTSKVFIIIVTVIMVFGMILTGCGANATNSTSTSSTQAATQPSAASTQAATTQPSNVTGKNVQFDPNKSLSGKLNVWFIEEGKPFIDTLFQDYKKYRPNVDLQVTYTSWGDYWKKLPVAISSGAGPDLFYFHNAYDSLMVGGGLMGPYPQDLVDNLKKDYVNVDQFNENGNTYYIGVGGGHGMIYYNKDLWSAAGLTDADFPQTWDQFRTDAVKLTKKSGDKISVAGFNYNPGMGYFLNDIELLSGRFVFSADGKQLLIDNADFKKSFQFFVDMYKKDKVCSSTYPDAQQSFLDGTSAMIWNHPFFAGTIKTQKPNLNYGVFPLPKFDGMARNWHYNNPDVSMGISAKISPDAKVLAVDLLDLFFADDKYMKAWDQFQNIAPTKISLQNDSDLMAVPMIKAVESDFDNSVYLGAVPDQEIQDLIQTMVDPVLGGSADIDSAVKAGVAKVNQDLGGMTYYPAERSWSHASELK